MAKAKPRKRRKAKSTKLSRAAKNRASTKKKSTRRRSRKTKARASLRRFEVATISSGSTVSTLDPRGQLIVERELEAKPRSHKGDLSGDLQGMSSKQLYDSQSVSELIEEGQDLEAELLEGVEEARDADQGEVRVHEAPEPPEPDYNNRRRI